ncbi:plasmid transfer protein TraA [Embleya sp. NPDC056575]|uniref:plasmid transfer protein TraA n=1 Tax=unclassified Embleya TaxID=2699296 RepID=UPI0036856802
MSNPILGDTELITDVALREYCDRARKAFRLLAIELNVSAEELQAFLKEVPDPPAGSGFSPSHKRARLIAGHVRTAADASQHAAASMVRAWRSFERQYELEMNPTKKKSARAFGFEGN